MLFDYKFYTNYHKDLKDKNMSFIDASNHFLTTGLKEYRVFNEKLNDLDYKFYIDFNEDLKSLNMSFIEACNHYLNYGCKENRYNSVDSLFSNNVNSTLINNYNNDKINNYKFLHITKTGGTSIEEFGFKLGIKWGRYDRLFYENNKNFKKLGFWHVPLNYLDKETINKYKWFTIVRNPYHRIISEINFLIKSNHLQFNKVDMNVYLYEILCNIYTNDKNNKKILNKEFIEKNDKMYAFHFIPMYHYTCDLSKNEETISNIKIIKFENLNSEINTFLKELGIVEKFDVHENKNDKKQFEIDDLSIKNIKLINEVYKKDFNLFNYTIINI